MQEFRKLRIVKYRGKDDDKLNAALNRLEAEMEQAVQIRTKLSKLEVMADQLKVRLDSMTEMGEMESLRLQMAMDRMSKMMSALSNMLKKISDTAGSITQNMK